MYLQDNMLAGCIREKEWAFQSFIIRSLAWTSPRDFIQNSVKSVGVSSLWINTLGHNKKGLKEIIRKKYNFHLLYLKCSELFSNWKKRRNFIAIWSFHIYFQYIVFGWSLLPEIYVLHFVTGKEGKKHGLAMNNPYTPKIRFEGWKWPLFAAFLEKKYIYNEKT